MMPVETKRQIANAKDTVRRHKERLRRLSIIEKGQQYLATQAREAAKAQAAEPSTEKMGAEQGGSHDSARPLLEHAAHHGSIAAESLW